MIRTKINEIVHFWKVNRDLSSLTDEAVLDLILAALRRERNKHYPELELQPIFLNYPPIGEFVYPDITTIPVHPTISDYGPSDPETGLPIWTINNVDNNVTETYSTGQYTEDSNRI